ncbi:Phosphoglycerol transferase MdoB [Ruminococcaceae bacterium YRB3002]|nr:Phosphoglycerol transferase MdoB [Ruminococcaceae bacterium YRB3002]
MHFSIKIGVKDIPRLAVAFVLALVPSIFSVTRYNDALIWYIGLFLLTFVTLTGKEEGKSRWAWMAFDAVLPVFAAGFSVYFMQYINLVDHERVSTVPTTFLYEIMYGTERMRFFYELPIIAGFYFFLRMCTVSRRFSAAFTPLPFMLVGLIDYFTYNARGHEVLASDIYSIKTAMNVASEFSFPLLFPLVFVAMPYALYFIACLRIKKEPKLLPAIAKVAISLALCILLEGTFIILLDKWSKTNSPQAWMDKGSVYNGLLMNLCLSAHALHQKEPEGYTNSYVDERAASLGIDPNDPGAISDDSANVILILSESYMQLKDYLPMLGCFEDPTPYWNGLKENAVHGYLTSSVYGGNTPNSEFELLTSITTGYLPTGSIPYTMFIDKDTYSLAWALDNLGYESTAMHCYLASGWQRTKVYPLLGFDNMMFIDDFQYTDDDLVREYVSDQCAYENLVNYLDSKKDKHTFTFLITMQNHGGYQDAYDNFPIKEYVRKSFTGDTFQVNNYINLAHKSDAALEWLIDTLSKKDEKYCVLIFGDHQPPINGFTNNMAPGKGTSWCVPYIIWTNYEMDQDFIDSQAEGIGYTSLNYIALDVLKAAHIDYPAYYQMVDSTRGEVPCINATGYYSNALDKFLYIDKVEDPSDEETLSAIRKLQYAYMFDNDNGAFETALHNTIDSVKKSRTGG